MWSMHDSSKLHSFLCLHDKHQSSCTSSKCRWLWSCSYASNARCSAWALMNCKSKGIAVLEIASQIFSKAQGGKYVKLVMLMQSQVRKLQLCHDALLQLRPLREDTITFATIHSLRLHIPPPVTRQHKAVTLRAPCRGRLLGDALAQPRLAHFLLALLLFPDTQPDRYQQKDEEHSGKNSNILHRFVFLLSPGSFLPPMQGKTTLVFALLDLVSHLLQGSCNVP